MGIVVVMLGMNAALVTPVSNAAIAFNSTPSTATPPRTPRRRGAVRELLVERARRGDRRALNRLLAREMPRVRSLLLARLGPRPDLDDLVQMTMMDFLKAFPRFRGDSQLSTFVGGIALMVARRARRPSAWDVRRTAIDTEMVDATVDPERVATERETVRHLEIALGKVKAPQREALIAWAIMDKTPQQIADETGTTLAAARSRIFYGQKYLKDKARRDPYLADHIGA